MAVSSRIGAVLAALVLACLAACDDGRVGAGADESACAGSQLFFCECPGIERWMTVCPGETVASLCPCGAAVPAEDAAPRPRPRPRPADAAPAASDAALAAPDAALPAPDAALPVDPSACAAAPAFVTVADGGRAFDVFTYEASHPLATAGAAFPGAVGGGESPRAPSGEVEACSRPGVRPWHSVGWGEADAACARAGWRLCTARELRRACEGPGGNDWTWGDAFEAGACNVREAWRAPGSSAASEAPAGAFARCVSTDGAHDLTGNLWEWTAADGPGREYQGAGWRTIAERHRDRDLVCAAQTRLVADVAATYANGDVGFRCCRDR